MSGVGLSSAPEAVIWTSVQQQEACPRQDVTGTGEGTAVPGHQGGVAAPVLDHLLVLLAIAMVAQPRGTARGNGRPGKVPEKKRENVRGSGVGKDSHL